jgi:phage shock protein C
VSEQTSDGPAERPLAQGETAATTERRLRRSTTDRIVAGVCGGLGRHFGVDPVILRVAFVILVFAGGSGILLYLLGWVLIPEERPGDAVAPPAAGTRDEGRGSEMVGLVLIALGAFFLLRLVLPDFFDAKYVWPIVLIVLGVVLVLRGGRW